MPEGAKTRLGKGRINDIAYSPDGTRIAVASSIGIWLYDTVTYSKVALLTGHTKMVQSVSFSPEGTTLATGTWDGTVLLWDLTGPTTYNNPSQRMATVETQQELTTGKTAWLGTWSLELINGQSTAENLAGSLKSDIFLSWNYTFYVDGRFEAKLRQDTGKGIITTTTYRTYEVSGNRYNTVLKEAIMSMGPTSVPIPDMTSYQSGTWLRTGDTLTVIPVDSATKVFKLNIR